MEWNRKTIVNFINLIKERPAIWDSESLEFKNKRKRKEAIEEVGILMGVTPMDVNTKWTILKFQYNRERKKVTESKGSDSPYITKWYAYREMDALMRMTHNIQQKVATNFWMQERNSDEEDSSSSMPHASLLAVSASQHDHRRDTDAKTASMLDQTMKTLKALRETNNDRKDELTNFGLYIAGHIRNYSPALQSRAKYEINKILYRLDLEKFGVLNSTVISVEDNDVAVVNESKYDPLEKD